jgi:hypothetical protein
MDGRCLMLSPPSSTFRDRDVLACRDRHAWPAAAHVPDVPLGAPHNNVCLHQNNTSYRAESQAVILLIVSSEV